MNKGMVKNSVYVSFDNYDFLEMRKKLLTSQINAINILKRYKEFKRIKIEEKKIKRELTRYIKEINKELEKFIESIPKISEEVERLKEEAKKKRGARKIIRISGKKSKSKLDAELEKIKEKLASLG